MVSHNELNTTSLGVSEDFKSLLNTSFLKELQGIIKSVVLRNNTVFAVVQQDEDDGHDSYFNVPDYAAIGQTTLAELVIPTDISPVNNNLNRFIGAPVAVTVRNGTAVYASTFKAHQGFTDIPVELIKQVREDVTAAYGDKDIFSSEAERFWKRYNIDPEDVSYLKDLIYDPEEHDDKIISFTDEASWIKDIQDPLDNEVVLAPIPIMRDLNSKGMKTNKCHYPTLIFSAK